MIFVSPALDLSLKTHNINTDPDLGLKELVRTHIAKNPPSDGAIRYMNNLHSVVQYTGKICEILDEKTWLTRMSSDNMMEYISACIDYYQNLTPREIFITVYPEKYDREWELLKSVYPKKLHYALFKEYEKAYTIWTWGWFNEEYRSKVFPYGL